MISRRTQIVMLVLVVASTFFLSALWQNLTDKANSTPTDSHLDSERAHALTVLRAWDKRRAAAYANGDPEALGRLYLPTSASGANDQRLLEQYVARGLRIEGMSTQVLGVEILSHSYESLVLVVTDRLASAVAIGKNVREVLPRDEANTRRIELRRVGEQWLVSEVDEDPQAQPRPVESTSRTPGS